MELFGYLNFAFFGKILLLFSFSVVVLFLILFSLRRYILNKFFYVFDKVFDDVFEKKKKKYNKEDERYRDKELELKKEKKLAHEQKVEQQVEVISKQKNKEPERIVGLKFKVFGKFTAKFVESFLANIRVVDEKDIENKGYYQAQEIAKKSGKSGNIDKSF